MSAVRWRTLSEETLLENPWWRYKRDTFELPSGAQGEYHYVETPGSVMVVPVASDGRVVVVRQYRYLNGRESVEFPGGGIPHGYEARAAAEKELREEAGIEAGEWTSLGIFNPYNGVTSELCHVFLVQGHRSVPTEPVESEECEALSLTREEFSAMVASGEIWDGMTLAAWAMALLSPHFPATGW
jgi:ADP-ribose pyrophosphatase